jgi:uncharacterized membrane protein
MWDVIVGLGKLIWAMFSSAFSLYKQLTGIQNDILAAALGISPVLLTVLCFLLKSLKRLLGN